MSLRAIKPEIVRPAKPKFLISGKSGVGKTLFAMSFENPYVIDVEGGAVREQYMARLKKANGAYFGKEQGSQDFKIVIEEIKQLATEKHDFKTLVIDSFTKLYNMAAAIAEENVGSDFGRDKKEANKPTRQLIRWLEKIDLTVILICHQKDKWERKGKDITYVGTTFDGWEKLEYEFDLWLEIQKDGKQRSFTIKKSRIDGFQEGMEYPLEYEKFCELYGENVIKAPVKPLVMATKAQVDEIKKLVELVRLDAEIIDKWFSKAEVEDWAEMSEDQIKKCIGYIRSKIDAAKDEQGIKDEKFKEVV